MVSLLSPMLVPEFHHYGLGCCFYSTCTLSGVILLEEQVLSGLLPPYPGDPHLESPSLFLPDPHGTVWGGEGVAAWIWVKMMPQA